MRKGVNYPAKLASWRAEFKRHYDKVKDTLGPKAASVAAQQAITKKVEQDKNRRKVNDKRRKNKNRARVPRNPNANRPKGRGNPRS